MGYYTTYTLYIDGPTSADEMIKWIDQDPEMKAAAVETQAAADHANAIAQPWHPVIEGPWELVKLMLVEQSYNMKWYEHQDELIKFSTHFPYDLFTLEGEGEESGDLWKMYVRNGSGYISRASIVFEDVDVDEVVPAPEAQQMSMED